MQNNFVNHVAEPRDAFATAKALIIHEPTVRTVDIDEYSSQMTQTTAINPPAKIALCAEFVLFHNFLILCAITVPFQSI